MSENKQVATLSGREVKRLLDLACPDEDDNKDQLDTEVSICWMNNSDGEMKYFACLAEYPEEGYIQISD